MTWASPETPFAGTSIPRSPCGRSRAPDEHPTLRQPQEDPYTEYVDRRPDEGLENCVVLLRELKAQGYDCGYSILKSYVSPRRRRRQPDATMRLETPPGELAQVDGAVWPTWTRKAASSASGYS